MSTDHAGMSPMFTHLDDQVSLGITSHPSELCSQLLELGPTVCVDHPACENVFQLASDQYIQTGGCLIFDSTSLICKLFHSMLFSAVGKSLIYTDQDHFIS